MQIHKQIYSPILRRYNHLAEGQDQVICILASSSTGVLCILCLSCKPGGCIHLFFYLGSLLVVRSYYELQGEQNLVIFTLSINASLGPEPSEPSRCP